LHGCSNIFGPIKEWWIAPLEGGVVASLRRIFCNTSLRILFVTFRRNLYPATGFSFLFGASFFMAFMASANKLGIVSCRAW
jgi:hypothetical protein